MRFIAAPRLQQLVRGITGWFAFQVMPGTQRLEAVARLVASLFTEDIAFLTGEAIYIDGGQGVAH